MRANNDKEKDGDQNMDKDEDKVTFLILSTRFFMLNLKCKSLYWSLFLFSWLKCTLGLEIVVSLDHQTTQDINRLIIVICQLFFYHWIKQFECIIWRSTYILPWIIFQWEIFVLCEVECENCLEQSIRKKYMWFIVRDGL